MSLHNLLLDIALSPKELEEIARLKAFNEAASKELEEIANEAASDTETISNAAKVVDTGAKHVADVAEAADTATDSVTHVIDSVDVIDAGDTLRETQNMLTNCTADGDDRTMLFVGIVVVLFALILCFYLARKYRRSQK